jgi:molecular chaperone GrpE
LNDFEKPISLELLANSNGWERIKIKKECNLGVMPGMSEKVQTEIEEPENQDQSEEPTQADTQTPHTSQDGGEESRIAGEDQDPSSQLQEARQQAQENYDRLLRVSAEFDNYKKRAAREMQDVIKYANEKIFKELLTVVDNLERAIEAAGVDRTDDDPLVKGIHLTLSEVLKILERHKVNPVKAMGEPFDPAYHQAMMQEEVEDQAPNTVVREMQKGYMIHDRLLRPAMVVVSKAKAGKTERQDE